MAACTELSPVSLTQKHLVIPRKVRAQRTRVLKAMSDALPRAGAVLDHFQ